MSFRVGQKVECIVAPSMFLCRNGEVAPSKGGVYTIRAILGDPSGDEFVRLNEIVNEPRVYDQGFEECCFDAAAFRPIVDRATDIRFAHDILRKVSDRVRA
jgi:hypothetical protein